MNSFGEVTVLSTACASMFMPGFFSCLRENGERNIRLIGADIVDHPFMERMIDNYYQVPRYSELDYIDCLLDICREEKVDVFFPQISMELPIILARINDFRAIGVRVAISDNTTLNIANNKFKLYEFMAEQGMTTPQYFHVSNSDELIERAHMLGFPLKPVVVKMTESSGSRGVRIIRDDISLSDSFINRKPGSLDISLGDMCKTIDDCNPVPDLIVMEYLPGCEYTVDLLADHGKTLYIAGRRNTESNASIAMASYTEEKKDAYTLCERIVELLKLDGNIGFDFMLDSNDNPVLTDLNPRVTATIVLYKKAGLNFPYLRVKQLLGEKLPAINVKYGVRMRRKYHDIFE